MSNSFAKILLPLPFEKAFDYAIPDNASFEIGEIVKVPFGKKQIYGVILSISDKSDLQNSGKIKSVIASAKAEGFQAYKISENLLKLINWQADYTVTEKGRVLGLAYNNRFFKAVKERSLSVRKGAEISKKNANTNKAKLSNEQEEAFKNISGKLDKFSITLLEGITGSGKTEVYFEIINLVLQQHKQVLIMLPEILLTTQMIKRFEKRFGFKPVIWHSTVSEAKRRKAFFSIASGDEKVVIGARSSLHLPYKDLGLIIADEEHDASFKQEDQVIYNARDIAVVRAKFENIPIILSSATPSIETYNNAKTEKYNHVKLRQRFNDAELPEINLIDMRQDSLNSKEFISHKLREEIKKNLESGQQSLLFLNRRGYAPLTLCSKCGFRFKSPDTSAWMVMHMDVHGVPYLRCHHSGYTIAMPDKCPSCKAENSFRACGPGVQRLAEEVKTLFPTARVMQLVSDVATSQAKMAELITSIENNEIDIIIGTQIIAKGHHFPSLSLVGVIDGDLGLDIADLRAGERSFQLLHQVSGRAGRAGHKGRVFIQTFKPEHKIMQALLKNDLPAFLEFELGERKEADMPPFSRLCAITISSNADTSANKAAKSLISNFDRIKGIKIYGPVPALYHEYRGSFRYRILIKADKGFDLQNYVKKNLVKTKLASNIKVKIDIDPISFS